MIFEIWNICQYLKIDHSNTPSYRNNKIAITKRALSKFVPTSKNHPLTFAAVTESYNLIAKIGRKREAKCASGSGNSLIVFTILPPRFPSLSIFKTFNFNIIEYWQTKMSKNINENSSKNVWITEPEQLHFLKSLSSRSRSSHRCPPIES